MFAEQSIHNAIQVSRSVALIPQVGVVCQSEGELAVRKVIRGLGGVVQPLEERPEGKEALVEGEHDFGIGILGRGRNRPARC